MNALDQCTGCACRLANGQDPVCDGSGVIAISDIPESRVVVCPSWPCDEDEPLAYFQAVEGLGYDQMPATVQERIRASTLAEVRHIKQETFADRHAPYAEETIYFDEGRVPMIVSAGVLISFMALCIGILVWVISR